MKRYAVAHMDYFENDLKIEVVEASSVREALGKHSKLAGPWAQKAFSSSDSLEKIKKTLFFYADQLVDIVEI